MLRFTGFASLSIFIMAFSVLIGRSFRVQKIPNGSVNSCANCHINAGGGGARNLFGLTVESRVTPGGTEDFWSAELASLDSDGDGFTNGEELQDPGGTWANGTIGDPALVTNPGDPNSFPEATDLENQELPVDYILSQNYPNPFNPTTKINFTLAASGFTKMEIFNIQGEIITELVNAELIAGKHTAFWNGRDFFGHEVASGTYIYRLQSGNFVESKMMLLLK